MQPRQKELQLELDGTACIDLIETELPAVNDSNHVLRAFIIGLLMLWIVIAFLAGINEPDALY